MESLEIDAETLESLDLVSAGTAESESSAELLPSTVVDRILGMRREELGAMLSAELRLGRRIGEPEILMVPKPRRGRRPVAILGPRERVLYRALTDGLGEAVPSPDRSMEAFESFKRAPLDDEADGQSYVLMADVSSCYQYLDHQVIHREIVTRTADPFLAESVVDFLQAIEGNSFGLPQNRTGSHRLAELVLSIPERLMRRRGYSTWRYSDDFRVAVTNRSEAYEAIDDLSEALRLVGLTLNDEKTSVKTVADYESWASALAAQVSEFVDQSHVDLGDFTYEGDFIEPDQSEVMSESAGRMLDHWISDESSEQNHFGPAAVARRQMLNLTMGVLGTIGDSRALPATAQILDADPSMARRVSSYMESIRQNDEEIFDEHFDQLISNPNLYFGPWQILWLLEPLKRTSSMTSVQARWVSELTMSRSAYVSASASLVLAHHNQASLPGLINEFDSLLPAAASIAVAAIAVQAGGERSLAVDAVLNEDPFHQWIFDAASEV